MKCQQNLASDELYQRIRIDFTSGFEHLPIISDSDTHGWGLGILRVPLSSISQNRNGYKTKTDLYSKDKSWDFSSKGILLDSSFYVGNLLWGLTL